MSLMRLIGKKYLFNIFENWAIPELFFFISVISIQTTAYKYYIVCQWLDSNRKLLVMDVTVQPTEPQSMPQFVQIRTDLNDMRTVRSEFEQF